MNRSPKQAFTLIELLLVLSILLILSSMAMINYTEAQARAKISRAQADMYAVATALEAFHADHNRYPSNPAKGYNVIPAQVTTPVAYLTLRPDDLFRTNRHTLYPYDFPAQAGQLAHYSYYQIIGEDEWVGLWSEGQPVSLVAVHSDGSGNADAPVSGNRGALQKYGQWVMWSAGPDTTLWHYYEDFANPRDPISPLHPPAHAPWGYSFDVPYDPTNGTISFGNIIRTQQGPIKPLGPVAQAGGDTAPTGSGGNSEGPATSTGGAGEGGQSAASAPDATGQSEVAQRPPAPNPGVAAPSVNAPGGDQPRGADRGGHGASSPSSTLGTQSASPTAPSDPSAPAPAASPAAPGAAAEFAQAIKQLAPDAPPPTSPRNRPIARPLSQTFAWWLLILGLLLLLAYFLLRSRRDASAFAYEGRQITDGILRSLVKKPLLTELYLANSRVTDSGLIHLAGLKTLETLDLWHTGVTDAGLLNLKGLHSLHTLNLSDTGVTDAGLAHLAALPQLETLQLMGTTVSNAGLKELARIKSLKSLNLRNTHVSPEGLENLKRKLPGCEIQYFESAPT